MTTQLLTNESLITLRGEAGAAGDLEMVAMVDLALEGYAAAQRVCEEVMRDARVMDDDTDR